MRQLSTRDLNDTENGQRVAFNSEQSPYRIVSYKRPRNDNGKNSNEKTNGFIYVQKNERKTNM